MAPFATVDFPLEYTKFAAGADLAALPIGTQQYLRGRGLAIDKTTYRARKPFQYGATLYAFHDVVSGLPAAVMPQLVRTNYVVSDFIWLERAVADSDPMTDAQGRVRNFTRKIAESVSAVDVVVAVKTHP